MSSYHTRLSQAGLLGLTKEVRAGRTTRYLYYTRYAEEDEQECLVIGLSDGVGVWRVKLAEDALIGQSGPEADSGKLLSDVGQALQSGKMELTKLQDVMKMTVSCTGTEMDFDLTEVSAAERREESRTLLFTLWDSLEDAKCQAKKNVDIFSSGVGGALATAGGAVTESTTVVSRPKRIKGASVFNPNTKKRKVATGVVFGSDNN